MLVLVINVIKCAAFNMSKAKHNIKDASKLKENLLPPSAPSTPVANNVSMKLPNFWPDAAEVWFAQSDAQFVLHSIKVCKTKFYHAVAVLPQEVASQIWDLIQAPPVGVPYKVLKEH